VCRKGARGTWARSVGITEFEKGYFREKRGIVWGVCEELGEKKNDPKGAGQKRRPKKTVTGGGKGEGSSRKGGEVETNLDQEGGYRYPKGGTG